MDGKSTLISSPTGSGKTLSAFLGIIDRLYTQAKSEELEEKIYCVYVSPLKALGNDIEKNLSRPLEQMAKIGGLDKDKIRVSVRTGDTSAYEKNKMISKPPHILITTPESLALALASPVFSKNFQGVEFVVVDEVHDLCASLRGTQLALSLEWLTEHSGKEQVRIGLSATQSPIKEIAKFLGGRTKKGWRDVSIVEVEPSHDIDISTVLCVDDMFGASIKEVRDGTVDKLIEIIDEHDSTLVFTNTRAATERIVQKLKDRGIKDIAAHHGSMGREQRLEVEEMLRKGQLRATISSTSLELGIDIGSVDVVCLVGLPNSISKALQRLGRSGHSIYRTTKGIIVPQTPDEVVKSIPLTQAITRGKPDRVRIPMQPHDVLAQFIIGTCLWKPMALDEVFEIATRSYPFKDLSRQKLKFIVDILSGSIMPDQMRALKIYSRVNFDKETQTVKPRRGTRVIFNLNSGTIIDEDNFYALTTDDDQKVGNLSSGFVSRLSLNDVFVLGGSIYQVVKVEGRKVLVDRVTGKRPTIPSWQGEVMARSRELSTTYRKFLQDVSENLPSGDEFREWMVDDQGASEEIATVAEGYLRAQATNGHIPTESILFVEGVEDPRGFSEVVLHTWAGRMINGVIARHMVSFIERRTGRTIPFSVTDDSIDLNVGVRVPLDVIKEGLSTDIDRADFRKTVGLEEKMEQALMQFNVRSMVVPNRFRSGVSRVPPLVKSERLLEGMRQSIERSDLGKKDPDASSAKRLITMAQDRLVEVDFDVEGAQRLLDQVQSGKVQIRTRDYSLTPTPFSNSVMVSTNIDLMTVEQRSLLTRLLVDNIRDAFGATSELGPQEISIAQIEPMHFQRCKELGLAQGLKKVFDPQNARKEQLLTARDDLNSILGSLVEGKPLISNCTGHFIGELIGSKDQGTTELADLHKGTQNAAVLFLLRTYGPMELAEIEQVMDGTLSTTQVQSILLQLVEHDVLDRISIEGVEARKYYVLADDLLTLRKEGNVCFDRYFMKAFCSLSRYGVQQEEDLFKRYLFLRDTYSLLLHNIPLEESWLFQDEAGYAKVDIDGPAIVRKDAFGEHISDTFFLRPDNITKASLETANQFRSRHSFRLNDLIEDEKMTKQLASVAIKEGLATGILGIYPQTMTRTGLQQMEILSSSPSKNVPDLSLFVSTKAVNLDDKGLGIGDLARSFEVKKEVTGLRIPGSGTFIKFSQMSEGGSVPQTIWDILLDWGPVNVNHVSTHLSLAPDIVSSVVKGTSPPSDSLEVVHSPSLQADVEYTVPKGSMDQLQGLSHLTRGYGPHGETIDPGLLMKEPFQIVPWGDPFSGKVKPKDMRSDHAVIMLMGNSIGHISLLKDHDRIELVEVMVDLHRMDTVMGSLGTFLTEPFEEVERKMGAALGRGLISYIDHLLHDHRFSMVNISNVIIVPDRQWFHQGLTDIMDSKYSTFSGSQTIGHPMDVERLPITEEQILAQMFSTQGLFSDNAMDGPLDVVEKLLWINSEKEVRSRTTKGGFDLGSSRTRYTGMDQLENTGLVVRGASPRSTRSYQTLENIGLFQQALDAKIDRTMRDVLGLVGSGPVSLKRLHATSNMKESRLEKALKRLMDSGRVYLDPNGHYRPVYPYDGTPMDAFLELVWRTLRSFGVLDIINLSRYTGEYFSFYELRWALGVLMGDRRIRSFITMDSSRPFYCTQDSYDALIMSWSSDRQVLGSDQEKDLDVRHLLVIGPDDIIYEVLRPMVKRVFGTGRFHLIFNGPELIGGFRARVVKGALIVRSLIGKWPELIKGTVSQYCSVNDLRLFWSEQLYKDFKKEVKARKYTTPEGFSPDIILSEDDIYHMDFDHFVDEDIEQEEFDVSLYDLSYFS